MDDLKLYKLRTGETTTMPVDDVGPLIGNSLCKNIIRRLILREFSSKFFGFLCRRNLLSYFLSFTRLSDVINRKTALIFREKKSKNLNQAFTYRRTRKEYPLTGEVEEKIAGKVLISPADAYLNIRDIVDGKVEIYPELKLNIEKMIGTRNARKYSTGKLLLFTLKPFHDHTIDYPLNSKVLMEPIEVRPADRKVYSTDLNFIKFIAKLKNQKVFSENHRVITNINAVDYNENYCFVEIGAVNVNSIEQDNCNSFSIYSKAVQKSHFNFGSTVIMLLSQKLSEKLYFPEIYRQDKNTSVEVRRRNIIALPREIYSDVTMTIDDEVKMKIIVDEAGIKKSEILYSK